MINFELLSDKNFNGNSLYIYERKQEVKGVYRREGSGYILVDMPDTEDGSLDK